MLSTYKIKVQSGEYDLKVMLKGGNLLVTAVKTTKQRKYRGLVEFYDERQGIKSNYIDSMLRQFGRDDEHEIKENIEYTDKLGINMNDVKVKYKEEVKKKILKKIETIEIQ